MDHHPAHQDPCVEQRPPHGDCQGADRTLQRACRRRPRVSHAQQQRVQQAPQTDSQSLRHPQGDRLPPKPPHLRHDHLSLQRRHHRGALQDTRAQAHFHDPDLRRGDQQDGKLRFPGDLRQPRRHAAERAGEEGQETGREAGAPLPPGNGLTPFPGAECGKGRNFRCGVPAFAAFPDAHPRAFMLDFSPVCALGACPRSSPPAYAADPTGGRASCPAAICTGSAVACGSPATSSA